ncbi:beta-galactosidase [Deinococcus sp. KSM4-11]|uniref:beta-galactosidase n=1 Tax=Deinococcus sp. KSM4-11 TaxID=2568654 RepID=UPI0010A58953|nr:beta-galactosidase [Deinococcus sp. KSM4-11]THF85716.1 beta-galactosidase [Deinococcus sp. KSM4-11]
MSSEPTSPASLLLGVCDYPEHVSPALWADFARQQRELGLSFVRLAEFAWSRMEPRAGEYDWAWLDEAIRVAADAGLKVVLCTPTAAPPAWLVQAHPDVLPVGRDGRVKTFGSRRHYDPASPVFREHSRRITRALAERYGQHPAVIGWQTDNEFGWGDTAQTYSPAAQDAFRMWLEARYGTLDALNEAWGNVFWSMEYSDWAQIPLPGQAVAACSPSHTLDFMRFTSGLMASFQAEQVDILRECSPGRFVTHNFMGFFSAYDHYELSEGLDFASWDSYPTGTLTAIDEWQVLAPEVAVTYARTGHPDITAFNHDLYRGLTRRGHWIMEQQCGQIDWAPSNPLPATGAVELWTAQAWAHGADGVAYFRWQAATMAQELLHSGLLRHDGTPDRGYTEVQGIDPAAYPLAPVANRVALLHDYESLWAYNAQPHASGMNYWAQTFAYYRALRALGVDVDIVHPDSDLGGYGVIVAPALTVMTPQRAGHLTEAATHAKVVFGPRTALRGRSGRAQDGGGFGPLSALLGARPLNFDSLPNGLEQAVMLADRTYAARLWAESYDPQGADTLATYAGGPLDGQAAVIRHGNVTVIGAHSVTLISSILTELLEEAGIEVTPLPEGIRLSRRGDLTLVQNWTAHAVTWQEQELAPVSSRVLTPAMVSR